MVRPGEGQWYSLDERPPFQALLQVERPTSRDGGERQGGDEGGDQLADERCSPAVLDFLQSTQVWRTAPPAEENWDSEGSEGDPGESGEDGAQEAEADGVEEQAG